MKNAAVVDFPMLRQDLPNLVADAEESGVLLKVVAEGCEKVFVELSGRLREVVNGLVFKYEYLE